MALAIKLTDILQKYKSREEVTEYLSSLGDEWVSFVDGEYKHSTEINTKSLGGQQPRALSGDDDEMDGSTSMEAILSRFSNFNSERSKRESINDDDDDDDDDDDEEENHEIGDHKEEEDEDRLNFLKDRDQEYQRPSTPALVQSRVKEQEPLAKEYVDNNYWKVELYEEKSIEELMAEMEL